MMFKVGDKVIRKKESLSSGDWNIYYRRFGNTGIVEHCSGASLYLVGYDKALDGTKFELDVSNLSIEDCL